MFRKIKSYFFGLKEDIIRLRVTTQEIFSGVKEIKNMMKHSMFFNPQEGNLLINSEEYLAGRTFFRMMLKDMRKNVTVFKFISHADNDEVIPIVSGQIIGYGVDTNAILVNGVLETSDLHYIIVRYGEGDQYKKVILDKNTHYSTTE